MFDNSTSLNKTEISINKKYYDDQGRLTRDVTETDMMKWAAFNGPEYLFFMGDKDFCGIYEHHFAYFEKEFGLYVCPYSDTWKYYIAHTTITDLHEYELEEGFSIAVYDDYFTLVEDKEYFDCLNSLSETEKIKEANLVLTASSLQQLKILSYLRGVKAEELNIDEREHHQSHLK